MIHCLCLLDPSFFVVDFLGSFFVLCFVLFLNLGKRFFACCLLSIVCQLRLKSEVGKKR